LCADSAARALIEINAAFDTENFTFARVKNICDKNYIVFVFFSHFGSILTQIKVCFAYVSQTQFITARIFMRGSTMPSTKGI
jgi:hypothetical protein